MLCLNSRNQILLIGTDIYCAHIFLDKMQRIDESLMRREKKKRRRPKMTEEDRSLRWRK
ncbi:hypothetical protein MUG91_G5n91 [Manis pentadactyla]|nr:hypothetical protein MUG91_G5n91 [Manis pentadactyla]